MLIAELNLLSKNWQVWAGNPAKFLRKLTEEEIAFISQSAINYANLAQVHAAENAKSFDQIEREKRLRKKYAHKDEEYDSMLGIVRRVPPELILPDNILPDKSPKPAQWVLIFQMVSFCFWTNVVECDEIGMLDYASFLLSSPSQ